MDGPWECYGMFQYQNSKLEFAVKCQRAAGEIMENTSRDENVFESRSLSSWSSFFRDLGPLEGEQPRLGDL